MRCKQRRLLFMERHCKVVSRARASCKFVFSRLLATITLFAAATVSTHAQTDWSGAVSSDWFTSGNWNVGVPTPATDTNIDTVTPNSTVIASAGATAQTLSVGQSGTGLLAIQNGGTLVTSFATLGNFSGSQGAVILSGAGSTWTNIGSVVVGSLGSGTLTIQNGGTVNSFSGSVGSSVGSVGTVIVTGPGSSWNIALPGGGLNIGSFGTGTLTIANGGMVINNSAFTVNVGNGAGSQGTVTVTGAGSTWNNSLGANIGNLGTGTLTIANSGIVTGPIVIATNAGAIGTLNIGAGAGNPAVAPGTLNAPSVVFGAGTGTLNFNHTSTSYVFAPAISGSGTVNVLAGSTTLTGANSYSGATNVNAGSLRAGAPNTFSPNSAVTIASGGILNLNGFSQTVSSITNAGLVNMGTGTAPGTDLTTTSYGGAGGAIAMNTFLGGDGSPSDKLVINGGSASSNSSLQITNAGGGGALTVGNGILVVDAVNGGTTVPDAFALAGPVVAGPYEYSLARGASDGSNPQGWYLRNTFNNPPGIGSGQIPTGTNIPFYRREVSLVAAIPSMILLYDYKILGTLHDRVGEQEQLSRNDMPCKSCFANGIWTRFIYQNGNYNNNGIYRDGPSFGFVNQAVQVGFDIYHEKNKSGSDFAGIFGTVGEGYGQVDHLNIVNAGRNRFNAYTFGGYYTHYSQQGWYVDSILENTYHDINGSSQRGLQSLLADGWGLSGSIEGGYNYCIAHGIGIEPEAQLSYERLWLANRRSNAFFNFEDTNSFLGRLGARLTKTWEVHKINSSVITGWLFGNVWHEFNGDSRSFFTSMQGKIPFASNIGGSWSDVGAGVTALVSRNVSIYATGNYQNFWQSHGHACSGEVGVRLNDL